MSALASASSGAQLFQAANSTPGGFNRAQFEQHRKAEFASALQSAGVDSSKIDDIQKQINAAVQGVRQNGGSGTDQRSAIKSAINGVLQKNGVDTTKFQAALRAQHAGRAQGAHKARGGKGDGDGDADDGGSAPSVGESSESSQASTINSQVNDLLKALATGTAQQSDYADLPVGSLVNVAA